MGYTNYWKMKNTNINYDVQVKYSKAIQEIHKFIEWVKTQENKKLPQLKLPQGYYKKDILPDEFECFKDEIIFNGIGEDEFETFYLPAIVNSEFNFTKTACKNYDYAVLCSMFILKKYLGDDIQLNSDGFIRGDIDHFVKFGYTVFKRFQKSLNESCWDSGGIINLFKQF